MKKKLVVAGASGFVGKEFIRYFLADYDIITLTRSGQQIPGTETRQCDLFSLLDAEHGVKGASVALYLVHSMLPSAKLSQGEFQDFDLVAADNFASACESEGVEHIVYLGGIVPSDFKLSRHLESRLEVENALGARLPKLTVLRSGLILGKGGSTALMLIKTVERLKVMICPSWTRTPTQAIDVEDVCKLLNFCLSRPELCADKKFDIGSGPPLSYLKLLSLTSKAMGVKRYFLNVPFFTPFLSHLWLTLITRAPRSLTKPIVQSLEHPIVCRDHKLEELADVSPKPLLQSLGDLVQKLKEPSPPRPRAFQGADTSQKLVRSIQRLPLVKGMNANEVAQSYLDFLNTKSFGIIKVTVQGHCARFSFLGLDLLIIEHSPERSHPQRHLFYIKGGLLDSGQGRGRLEFRVVPGVNVLIAALHDFQPRLPWWIYIPSQARIHLWTMKAFSSYLKKEAVS